MNKKILNLAIPNIISNISIPLLGIVDMALMGHLESDAYIGANDCRLLVRSIRLLTNNPDVIANAKPYFFWVILIPIISFAAFLWDGIYIELLPVVALPCRSIQKRQYIQRSY